MLILGVDPGSQNLGYGIVRMSTPTADSDIVYVNHGVLKIRGDRPFYERLRELGTRFSEIVEKTKPNWVSVEKVFIGKNVDSAFKLGHIRGVCIFECLKHHVQVAEYSTREIKKGVTGQGAAEKEQVALILESALHLAPGRITKNSLDASDALAAAYHHAQKLLLGSRLAKLDLNPEL